MSTLLTVLILAGQTLQPAPVVPLPQDVNRFATVTTLPPVEHHHHEPTRSVWDLVAACESGGDWSINTGNGYSGGLQWHPDTWVRAGGTAYAPTAHQATREQEIAVAESWLAKTSWAQWPACSRAIGLR